MRQREKTPEVFREAAQNPRFVSLLTKETLALVLAGGRGSRLGRLTLWRAKPATPFGGKFRIIDFPLSNCINSGIRQIGVLTQYKAHSLIRHIQKGWNFLRGEFDEYVELLPAQQRITTSWYQGTADAVYQNLDIIRSHNPEYVLILAGDHIYKMDYGPMIAYHVEHDADMTVACLDVPVERAKAFGIMTMTDEGRVVKFEEKPEEPDPVPGRTDVALASMGIYVFKTEFLFDQLTKDADDSYSDHDFGKDIIPSVIENNRVMAYPYRDPRTGEQGYWRDVGTVDAFWAANLELTGVTPELNIYDTEWPIWTYQEQLPPAKFVFDDADRRGMAIDSMVSGGCIISGGYVRQSVMFSNCTVQSRARVEESVVLPDVEIGAGAVVKKAVLDRGCRIPEGMEIGVDPDRDRQRFDVSPGGVVLITPEMLGMQIHHVR